MWGLILKKTLSHIRRINMAFKEVSSRIEYVRLKDTEPNTAWEGWYRDVVQSKKYETSQSVILESSDGLSKIGIPYSGHLKWCLASVAKDSYIKIVYVGLGKEKIKGHYPNEFKVFVDESKGSQGDDEDYEDDDEDDEDDEDEEFPPF